MRLVVRVLILLVMVRFAAQALIGYAFDFRTHGYPLWPLLGLGVAFACYLKLQPCSKAASEVRRDFSNVDHAFLLLILAAVSSAFLLDKRGEDPFTPTYFIHLSTLTLFLLLIPFIASCFFRKGRTLVTALATLILMFFLLDGTMKDPEPVVTYFQEAHAYRPVPTVSAEVGSEKPISISPPPLQRR